MDETDRALLRALQSDANLTVKELAAAVGLATSTVYERVRRLKQEGVLLGAHYEVDARALGVHLEAMVFVQLSVHGDASFRRYLQSLPEVRSWYHLAGRQDFAVHVVVRDTTHLRDLVMEGLTMREEVARVETSLIFEHERNPVLPDGVEQWSDVAEGVEV